MIEAFEGNKAETLTMIPTITSFMNAYQIIDVTVVADAGMISAARMAAIETAGLRFILGDKLPTVPYQIAQWRQQHAGQDPPDGLTLTQPFPANTKTSFTRDRATYYRFSHDRARRSLRGINEQVIKAEKAVKGQVPVKRNRFVKLSGADKSVNLELAKKARALAGWKAYTTNIGHRDPELVIGAYHQLWRIEKSFRMSKSDLAARPIYHHTEDSIRAHLAIAMATLAITRIIEARTGWSIKKFVTTARRFRTVEIQAGGQTLTAADPLTADLELALNAIDSGHQFEPSQATLRR